MNNDLIKKSLVFTTVFLFIGVAVAPSINFNVVKASQDDNLVEVTTQACGIQGYGNTTVKLTREQYQNLEQYLVESRARLNQTTTREEAVPIFKEAVVELNKYGLLPRGMSVERAQKFVTMPNQGNNNFEKLSNSLKFPQTGLAFGNIFCLLFMHTVAMGGDVTFGLVSLPCAILFVLFASFMFHFNNIELAMLLVIPLLLSAIIAIPSLIFNMFSPLLLWAVVVINSDYKGWSLGLKGLQQINEDLYWLIGFKGLRIWIPGITGYYIGQALATVDYLP